MSNDRVLRRVSDFVAANSRRSFLTGTAKFVGAGAAAMTLNAQTLQNYGSDVDSLNYALTLEYLESTFYTQFLGNAPVTGGPNPDQPPTTPGQTTPGQTTPNPVLTGPVVGNPAAFTSADFAGSTVLQGFNAAVTDNVFNYFGMIRDHEQAHVAALITAIRNLGGVPVQPCTYTFPVKTVDDFIKLAQTLENVGVSAYDGAIAKIQSPDLQTAAATIATVEARHAAYLNLLNGTSPFPSATDPTRTTEEVVRLIAPFLSGCATPLRQTIAIVTPNMITTNQLSIMLDASASSSANGALTYYFQILPGSKIPSFVQDANPAKASLWFVNGAGDYKLRLTVRDVVGNQSSQDINITYQP